MVKARPDLMSSAEEDYTTRARPPPPFITAPINDQILSLYNCHHDTSQAMVMMTKENKENIIVME